MSNILVTGGLGFIGHNVVARLEAQRHNVVILDNLTNYGIIPTNELNYLVAERKNKVNTYWNYNYDICGDTDISWLFAGQKFDTVIHLASFPRQKVVNRKPIAGSRVMNEGLINLLENSRRFGVKKFVYVSSSMVYGDYADGVKEDAVCAPISLYGIFKYAGELITKDYSRNYGIAHTIVRPSAVYGPLDVIDRVVAKFIQAAHRGETLTVNGADERLDFTYVDDAADGIVAAALNEVADNKTYNITRGISHSILEAAQTIVDIVGRGIIEIGERDHNFPSRGSGSIEAAKTDLGYDPKIDLETGLRRYYDWYKNSNFYNRDE